MRAHLIYGPWLPACLNCGETIGLKRLKAVPHARRCVPCQGLIDEEPAISDSVLALHEVDDWERARQAKCSRYQRRIGGFPQEAA